MKKIVVMISGSGSNLEAIIKACNTKNINGEIVCVISNNPDAYGIERAKKYLSDKDEENQKKITTLKVSKDLVEFELLSKAMIVKLAENDIKTLESFAGLTTDDLIGYLEDKADKNSKVEGLLEEFSLTKDEGDQLIMEARKIWLD